MEKIIDRHRYLTTLEGHQTLVNFDHIISAKKSADSKTEIHFTSGKTVAFETSYTQFLMYFGEIYQGLPIVRGHITG